MFINKTRCIYLQLLRNEINEYMNWEKGLFELSMFFCSIHRLASLECYRHVDAVVDWTQYRPIQYTIYCHTSCHNKLYMIWNITYATVCILFTEIHTCMVITTISRVKIKFIPQLYHNVINNMTKFCFCMWTISYYVCHFTVYIILKFKVLKTFTICCNAVPAKSIMVIKSFQFTFYHVLCISQSFLKKHSTQYWLFIKDYKGQNMGWTTTPKRRHNYNIAGDFCRRTKQFLLWSLDMSRICFNWKKTPGAYLHKKDIITIDNLYSLSRQMHLN